jgi:signal transduction histidine kinase
MASRLTDPAPYLATMKAIADDSECATQDSFELADAGRAFERHTGPVRDAAGELIGRIIVLREITAEREAERLKAEAERLKAEIAGERDSAQLKSELVATVSHELRTPLTSVLGFAELMLHHDLDEDTRKRYLQTIHSEAQRLTSLIDDFLDLEKNSCSTRSSSSHCRLRTTGSNSRLQTARSQWSVTGIASRR